jgi:RNA polymerase sigma factor (sigma-70 family)
MTDEDLMILVKEDNEDAFGILYKRYKDVIYRYVISLVGYNSFIEDVFQEVFLSIFKNRKTYRNMSKFSTYIFTISRSKCIDFIRKNRKYLDMNEDFMNSVSYDDKCDTAILGADVKRDFMGLIAVFPEKQRSAMYLKDIAELSNEEISAIINIPIGTVKTIIHRGREIIYKELRRKYV